MREFLCNGEVPRVRGSSEKVQEDSPSTKDMSRPAVTIGHKASHEGRSNAQKEWDPLFAPNEAQMSLDATVPLGKELSQQDFQAKDEGCGAARLSREEAKECRQSQTTG